jgi:hypothetical protein
MGKREEIGILETKNPSNRQANPEEPGKLSRSLASAILELLKGSCCFEPVEPLFL